METLRRFGMTELRPGQYVLVRFGPGSKGMMAAEIQPENGSPGLSSHYLCDASRYRYTRVESGPIQPRQRSGICRDNRGRVRPHKSLRASTSAV